MAPDQVSPQRDGDAVRGDGVGHAAQAVVALAAGPAVPRFPLEPRSREEDGTNGLQDAAIEGTGSYDLASVGVEHAGQRAEILEVPVRIGERDEPVGPPVLDEALDEARFGGLPAHDRLAGEPEPVGVIA